MLVRCVLAIAAMLFLSATQADARRGFAIVQFGTQETTHFLQDVRLKGSQGEALYLGYMTRTQSFFGPIYVSDAGYVLGIKGDAGRYFKMPAGPELARLQQSGALPKQLPPYRLTFGDYVMGYLLWVLLALAGIGYAIYAMLRMPAEYAYHGADRAVADGVRARGT